VAAGLQPVDETQFVLGRGPRKDVRVERRAMQSTMVESFDLLAAQDLRLVGEAELAGDLARRRR
jgi:hypothetical protein